MKTFIKTGFAAFMLLITVSCKKETIKTNTSTVAQSSDKTEAFFIGQEYEGGRIFWIDRSGKHGLIVSKIITGAEIKWSTGELKVLTGATDTAIGTGCINTKKIISIYGKSGNYAALRAAKYTGGGYKDWFLPSSGELTEIWKLRDVLDVFPSPYWSSTEYNLLDAWLYAFNFDKLYPVGKRLGAFVIAVRHF